jgi:osmoprotectant transport system permease protein
MNNGLPGLDSVGRWFNDPDNWAGPNGLLAHVREHLAFTGFLVLIAALIAVPIGVWIGHTGKGVFLVSAVTNALRAVPALGLLILLVVELSPRIHLRAGVGDLLARGALPYFIPAAIVLVVLAIPPLLTNTYAGIQAVDTQATDAARGAGMSPLQIACQVEIPCAMPLILAGLRSATLQVIASLTVAAYAPLIGGLGRLIVDGQQNLLDPSLGYPAMLSAGLTVAVLALAADAAYGAVGRLVISPGITYRAPRSSGPLRRLVRLARPAPDAGTLAVLSPDPLEYPGFSRR